MTHETGKRVAGFFILLAALSLIGATATASKTLIAVSLLCWAIVALVHFLPKKEDEEEHDEL
jgi:hypothetical protein